MNVLLVQPPLREGEHHAILLPPLGLAYVAAAARAAGHNVRMLDAAALGLTWRETEEAVRRERPDVLGATGMTPVIDTAWRLLRLARPHVRVTAIGGPHATASGAAALAECEAADYALAGEGERLFPDFLAALEQGEDPAALPGVFGRGGAAAAASRAAALPEAELAALRPARDLLPMSRYRYPLMGHGRAATIMSSRGCAYACTFCDKSVHGARWRGREAEDVLEEVAQILRDWRPRNLVFFDDLFTVSRERALAIAEGMIRRGLSVRWKCEARVDEVDPEMLALLRRAGCRMIAFGVESANSHGLRYLRKGFEPERALRAFDDARRAGLRTVGYFTVGIPVETFEDALRTVRFALRLRPHYAQFSILSPYVGTPLHEEAVRSGAFAETEARSPFDRDLRRPAYLSANWPDEGRLRRIVRDAHRRFYLRPAFLASHAAELALGVPLREAWRFLGWSLRPA